MKRTLISIIVTQRDRFSPTQDCIAALAQHTQASHELIVVDGNSPEQFLPSAQRTLGSKYGAHWLRASTFLRSNCARRLGLNARQLQSDFVIFIENDVIVQDDWLPPLLDRVLRSNAKLVVPLIYEGTMCTPRQRIHVAGLDFRFTGAATAARELVVEQYLHHASPDLAPNDAFPTNGCEFHCVMITAQLLEQLILDERFDALESHMDLSIQVHRLGYPVWVEPRSVVSFMNPELLPSIDHADIPYFHFTWEPGYVADTLAYAASKWGISDTCPYLQRVETWAASFRNLARLPGP